MDVPGTTSKAVGRQTILSRVKITVGETDFNQIVEQVMRTRQDKLGLL